jgi:hypothetical protein
MLLLCFSLKQAQSCQIVFNLLKRRERRLPVVGNGCVIPPPNALMSRTLASRRRRVMSFIEMVWTKPAAFELNQAWRVERYGPLSWFRRQRTTRKLFSPNPS